MNYINKLENDLEQEFITLREYTQKLDEWYKMSSEERESLNAYIQREYSQTTSESKKGLNLLTIEVWKFSTALIFLIYIGITIYSIQEGLQKTKTEVLWNIGVLLFMAINFYVAYAVVDNFKRIEKVIEKHHRN